MMKNLAIQQQQQPQVEENMSNLTSASGEASVSSSNRNDNGGMYNFPPPLSQSQPPKKKRNQPGHPDPDAEVIALSPRTLLATNRFVCEICNKGFQRDQNLQLHRRGHNLPWKLKQRTSKEIRKKVYVCPETSCVHHDPSRALGDLTGIKKHFCRKHGEKKWKCDKCCKKYAVQSDWKAHSKTCGTREYRCDCGTLFSRRDSFITHRAFCDALAEESARSITGNTMANNINNIPLHHQSSSSSANMLSHQIILQPHLINNSNHEQQNLPMFPIKKEQQNFALRPEIPPWLGGPPPPAPGPQTPIDLTPNPTPSSSSSIFQDFQQNHDHDHHRHHHNPNPNPSTTPLGPTLPRYHPPPPTPHISATALLQKAAQMGAKSSSSGSNNNQQCPPISSSSSISPAGLFIKPHHAAHVSASSGLNLSSRDELINGLASYGNKAATLTAGDGSSTASNPPHNPDHAASASLFHDMMMNNPGFGFEDMAFGGFLKIPQKNNNIINDHQDSLDNFHATLDQFSSSSRSINVNPGANEVGISDGMTRDFLGLRPLSQSDLLNRVINNNNNACNDQHHHNQSATAQKSWQG